SRINSVNDNGIIIIVSGPVCAGSVRVGRSVLELSGVIKCSTGRYALAYSLYGCYCGLGGQGWPRDNADWCCHRHDCCYATAQDSGCHTKPAQYRWSCSTDLPDCGTHTHTHTYTHTHTHYIHTHTHTHTHTKHYFYFLTVKLYFIIVF
uniref:Phospholipase A2 n=1 Tax=Astyanax mexicanus TaxID=7994 RepID=A0A8B9GQA9_ASTMX